MAKIPSLTLLGVVLVSFVSCETVATSPRSTAIVPERFKNVRTTAYTHSEGSARNAIGRRLSGDGMRSASADWSRYPLGTRFRIAQTGETHVIDDYGWALVGTDTIDLYKTSRSAMHRWGVRRVDIEILQWGSIEESLKVLRPRHRVGKVRRMIASLENKKRG